MLLVTYVSTARQGVHPPPDSLPNVSSLKKFCIDAPVEQYHSMNSMTLPKARGSVVTVSGTGSSTPMRPL